MTEGAFNSKLVKALHQRMPQAVVIKHADRFTAGIPDLSVTDEGRTTWVEVKLTTNKKIFEPLQLEMLRRLRRGVYIVWNPVTHKGALFMANKIDHKSYIPQCVYSFDELIREFDYNYATEDDI